MFFGAAGSRSAWQRFVDDVVTPRFPGGLTVLEGEGRGRGVRGLSHLEASHIVVIFYRRNAASDLRIEQIRTLYRARFRQASVLRADQTACVSF